MKKFVAVFCLLLCAATLQAKDKPNPADFPIKVHISSTQVVNALGIQFVVDTVLNGKKVKLGGNPPPSHSLWAVINPGDYQIRLKKDESEKDGSIIRQKYELLLPNGDTWECFIIGISE
jgi:hypothetical protein